MLRVDHSWMFLLILLQVSSAEVVKCNITFQGGQTLYSVPEFKATDCHYRWTNSTNHVLANQEGEIEGLVVTKSNRSLLMNGCLKRINYSRDCISEVTPHEANCTVDCSANETQTKEVMSRKHWGIVAVGLLLLPLGLYLCYKCRNHT